MNFQFSEEQELLRSQARKFLEKECSSQVVREVLESDQPFDRDLWSAVAELGWTGVAIPEEFGGLGVGYLELCVIAEELGRALAPVPFSSSIYLAAEALLLGGSSTQKQRWLPKIASGETTGAFAIAEGAGAPAWNRMNTKAETCGDGQFRINGVKTPVLDGLKADIAIVVALENQVPGLYLVDLNQENVTRTLEPSIDESRPHARITFSDALGERLGKPGVATIRQLLDRAAILVAFEQLGGADACLQMAVSYAKERFAFGRAIGSFQAIKHKLADMYAELELARSNCFFGAWALSTDDPELSEAAAVARLSISRAYTNCAKESIQVHGGIGFTWELDAHLYYRRSKLLNVALGSPARWQEYLIQSLEQKEEVAGNHARVA